MWDSWWKPEVTSRETKTYFAPPNPELDADQCGNDKMAGLKKREVMSGATPGRVMLMLCNVFGSRRCWMRGWTAVGLGHVCNVARIGCARGREKEEEEVTDEPAECGSSEGGIGLEVLKECQCGAKETRGEVSAVVEGSFGASESERKT
jgi:hypothetical protein